eukprot:5545959-Karenia_brevis.AAC.1
MAFAETLSCLEKLTKLCALNLPAAESGIDIVMTQHLIHHQAYNLVAPEMFRFLSNTSRQLSK